MLLAIDTSTRYGGVALWNGEHLLSAYSWHSTRNHTAELMPAVDYVLKRAGTRIASLEGIGVALGPGGFSALRVGISAAKGMAIPLDLPVMGVGTLEIEAYPYCGTGLPICPIMDVARGEVATATFRMTRGSWKKTEQERVCSIEEVLESISEPTVLCGEGVSQRSEFLGASLGDNGLIIDFHSPASRLLALGRLATQRLANKDVDALPAVQPLYLRRPSIGPVKTHHRVKR